MNPSDTKLAQHLKELFNRYILSFSTLDLAQVVSCYHLPCTLSTPDKYLLLTNQQAFEDEFSQIFAWLKGNEISAFKAIDASYQALSEHLILANITWQFFDSANNLFTEFTEFTAIYHLTLDDGAYKIINVSSVDNAMALSLQNPLALTVEK